MFQIQPAPSGIPVNQLSKVSTDSGKRSEMYIACNMPIEQAYRNACQILISNGYSPKAYKGEMIWKKGLGLATSMQYIKAVPMEKHLFVQGWVMTGIGDAVLMEQPLVGFVSIVPKNATKNVLMTIMSSC